MRRNTPLSRNNSGFTLIEMLIVAAIIAILIAVSIPMVNNALERARVATDAANERAFKAALTLCFLNNDDGTGAPFTTCDEPDPYKIYATYAYDAVNGKLLKSSTPSVGYGKCTMHAAAAAGNGTPMVLYGSVSPAGQVYMTWAPVNRPFKETALPPPEYNNIHGVSMG